jgi:P-type Cu+ transporter
VADGFDEDELLRLAAAPEQPSEHPLAASIVDEAQQRGSQVARSEGLRFRHRRRRRGEVDGRDVLVGKPSLLSDRGVTDVAAWRERAETLRAEGHTVMYVAVDGQPAGLLAVSDPIKETTSEAHWMRCTSSASRSS